MNPLLNPTDEVVSFDSEPLILVDEQDQEIGHLDKFNCHTGNGTLHRAFSLFIFNGAGELLLQQRSKNKLLWPLYWSNSCCSHPRAGETMAIATKRRLQQELGLNTTLQYLYKFEYQAPYFDIGSEHELCSVFVGHNSEAATVNENEIASWRYISAKALDQEMQDKPEQFTPWFKLEWQRLKQDYQDVLKTLNVHL